MRKTIQGFSIFILAVSSVSVALGDTKSTVSGVADAIAPALGLQSGTLPNASVNTDQCILGIDQDFQDGFDKDELSQYCSTISLEAIPFDPIGMKACGDTDMKLPDLSEESGKDQFCSMAGGKDDDKEGGFKKNLCELGRDLNCKKRAHKKTQNKIECIEKRLAELGQFMGQKLYPALEDILSSAEKQIKQYRDFINERDRQRKELISHQAEMDAVLASINGVLANKFVASQADNFYRDFQRSQEQEKTRYAIETCMNKTVDGLSCGGSPNMTPQEFVICRAGEVASGIKFAREPNPRELALMKSGSEATRVWLKSVLQFTDPQSASPPDPNTGARPKDMIMDDVSFVRRLNTTQIVFQEEPYISNGKKGVARVKMAPQGIVTEFQNRLNACKANVKDDLKLKERLLDNEVAAAQKYVEPMDQLSEAYEKLIRTATGNKALDISMATCDAGTLQVKRDCVYHLASQLRSAVSGNNESGHVNPYGRLSAQALGLRTLPNPHTLFNRPLKSELAFGGANMTINFNCRGARQCVQEYKNKSEEMTRIIDQGRAKLQPESSDMLAFKNAMNSQVNAAAAQISQITGAISNQWSSISSELSALKAEGAGLESDTEEGSNSSDSDQSGLPSIGKLMAQAKMKGGMLKVPNPGTKLARDNLLKAREEIDEKYASLATILSGYATQVASCESKSKKKAFDNAIAACEKMPKVSTSLSDLVEWWQENGGGDALEADWEDQCKDPGKTVSATACVDAKRKKHVAEQRAKIQKARKEATDLSNGIGDDGTDGVSCDQLALQAVKEYGKKYGSGKTRNGEQSTGIKD